MTEPKKKAGRPKKEIASVQRCVMMTKKTYDDAILIGGGSLKDGVALAIEAYKVKGDKK